MTSQLLPKLQTVRITTVADSVFRDVDRMKKRLGMPAFEHITRVAERIKERMGITALERLQKRLEMNEEHDAEPQDHDSES